MTKRGMDVFTLDGEYVGTVLHVSCPPHPAPLSRARPRGSPRDAAGFSGESLGPAPTASLGNSGPATQARTSGFGAVSDVKVAGADERRVGHIVVFRLLVPRQWSAWTPLLRRLRLELVQTVTLERVILSVTAEELARR